MREEAVGCCEVARGQCRFGSVARSAQNARPEGCLASEDFGGGRDGLPLR